MDLQSESAAIYVLVSLDHRDDDDFDDYADDDCQEGRDDHTNCIQVVASLYLVMVVIMVATNYRMKERIRRPMRRKVEEDKEEEEAEVGEEVESAVTMEGRVLLEGVTKLPRGVVEV